ncbi:DNA primase family protein [Adhaeribacter radiodurans]|uniref:DNA primase n=1 Tax=Adhaeribacter radiodurans TaxID=2745197 RepID=A0A7L7L5S4_9BACT|nr:phage/plasmid primase, P4 family [Adhaeribacter radiodurans]QMU28123.1 DNA primase [Adhaeribacter radiodurans]
MVNPETIIKHVEQLVKQAKPLSHTEILTQLLKQFKPLDFEALAFPQVLQLRENLEIAESGSNEAKEIIKQLEKLKLNTKHLLVLSINNVLKVAEENKWGLCKNLDFIYLYNGAYWAVIDKEAFQKFLGEAAEKMGVTKFSAQFYQFREHLFKQFLATAYLPTPEQSKDVVLINLLNGTFEVTPKGTRLRDFDKTDFLTYQLPFEYNPEAKASLFETYLSKVLPDKQRQKVLSEYLGYVFIKNGTIKEEKVLFLYGTGANGKSVFHEVVKAMLGNENISQYSLQDLTNENGYYRAMIANKRVNYASEISGKLQAAIFKQLASGETVSARLPYGNPMQISDYARLIFNVNELPRDVEQSDAFFRRFLIIPFDVTIPEAEQDKQLHIKIIEGEISGVFNWVLEGLNRLLQQKQFTHCEASHIAREQYKTESDSVKMFLEEEQYSISLTQSKAFKDLYNEYKSYCLDCGFIKVQSVTFSKRLKAIGYQIIRQNYGMKISIEKKDNF